MLFLFEVRNEPQGKPAYYTESLYLTDDDERLRYYAEVQQHGYGETVFYNMGDKSEAVLKLKRSGSPRGVAHYDLTDGHKHPIATISGVSFWKAKDPDGMLVAQAGETAGSIRKALFKAMGAHPLEYRIWDQNKTGILATFGMPRPLGSKASPAYLRKRWTQLKAPGIRWLMDAGPDYHANILDERIYVAFAFILYEHNIRGWMKNE